MNGSLGQFKATLQRRKERKEKNGGMFGKKPLSLQQIDRSSQFDFPKLSATELEQIKTEIREKIKSDNRRHWLVSIMIIILVSVGIFLVL